MTHGCLVSCFYTCLHHILTGQAQASKPNSWTMHLAVIDPQNHSRRLLYFVDGGDGRLGSYAILPPTRHGALTVFSIAKIASVKALRTKT
jgi:hypothetical protein